MSPQCWQLAERQFLPKLYSSFVNGVAFALISVSNVKMYKSRGDESHGKK
jgi:hypothetical protein